MKFIDRIINLLNKIFKLIFLLKKKIVLIEFKNPQIKKVLIVDHIAEDTIKTCILKDIEYEVLDTRLDGKFSSFYQRSSVRIFISFKILYYIFYYFFIKRTNSLFNAYVYSYIHIVNPKVVINQTKYGFLFEGAKLLPNINFVFLVDSLLSNKTDKLGFNRKHFQLSLIEFAKKNSNITFNNIYLSLNGLKDKDILLDLGFNLEQMNIIVSGSHKAQHIKKKIHHKLKREFDITFISQCESEYLNNMNKKSDQSLFYKTSIDVTTIILKYLSKYIKKKNLSCLIQLRDQQKTNIEEVFFKSFFKEKQKVFFQKRENSFTSYHSILSSELTISAHSNLSYEAMLLERKSLLMPLKFSQFYKNSSKSFETDLSLWYWTIYEENYENFEDKVDQLLNMNNEKYFLNTKNQSNYIINSDDNEETLLRKTILNLV